MAPKRRSPPHSRADVAADERRLDAVLLQLERVVASLEARRHAARLQYRAAPRGTRAALRLRQRAEQARARHEAAVRLQHQLVAAISRARAQVLIVERDAEASINGAFRQFARDPAWRPRAVFAAIRLSPSTLGKRARAAKQAVLPVILDRLVLEKRLQELRGRQTKFEEALVTTAPGSAEHRAIRLQLRLARLEVREVVRLYQDQVAAARRLLRSLRLLFRKLPPAALAVALKTDPSSPEGVAKARPAAARPTGRCS